MSSRKRKLINKKAKVEIERYPLVEVEWTMRPSWRDV
jgi:hypothetical protein